MSSVIIRYASYGLGDQFICHGLVREYCKRYDRVAIFARPLYYASVAFMYRDQRNLAVIRGDETFAKRFILENAVNAGPERYDAVKIVGLEYLDRRSPVPFEKQFYDTAGVDLKKKWENFFVRRDRAREQAFFDAHAPTGQYLFLHDDAARNMAIDRKKIDGRYRIFSPDPQMTENIFDYCTVIERAAEVHVIDSSLMFLVDCLPYESPGQRLFVHRYARVNEPWSLPILKKRWHIVTEEYNKPESMEYARTLFYKTLNHRLLQKPVRAIYRVMGWRTRKQRTPNPDPMALIRRYAPGRSFAEICVGQSGGAGALTAEDAGARQTTAVVEMAAAGVLLRKKEQRQPTVEIVRADERFRANGTQVGPWEVVFCSTDLSENTDPFLFLKRLRALCGGTLILHTRCIPEMPGVLNMAIFSPHSRKKQTSLRQTGAGRESGNRYWELTGSAVESLLRCAGFEMLEKHALPFEASFVCTVNPHEK